MHDECTIATLSDSYMKVSTAKSNIGTEDWIWGRYGLFVTEIGTTRVHIFRFANFSFQLGSKRCHLCGPSNESSMALTATARGDEPPVVHETDDLSNL